MIALEIAGLVEIRSGSGVYVLAGASSSKPTGQAEEVPGPLEILEARHAIEGETAALAATRIDQDALAALRRQLEVIADPAASTEKKEAADQQFHQLIAEASGNSALHSTIIWLWDLRSRTEISHTFHERLRQEGSTPVVRDHTAILEALEQGDAEAARRQMHRHLQRVLDLILTD